MKEALVIAVKSQLAQKVLKRIAKSQASILTIGRKNKSGIYHLYTLIDARSKHNQHFQHQ